MPLSGAVGPGFRLHGAMLSLLRLPHIRPMHDENSRNHALSVVAMLISPMLFIFFVGRRFALPKPAPSDAAVISSRRNQMARSHLSGGLPAVKTICSSSRMRNTSCGWISGRATNCFERVRDEPRDWKLRLT